MYSNLPSQKLPAAEISYLSPLYIDLALALYPHTIPSPSCKNKRELQNDAPSSLSTFQYRFDAFAGPEWVMRQGRMLGVNLRFEGEEEEDEGGWMESIM